jgi:S-adenosylmethionine-diacylglycerol 3-amino-3-carboxypropyl transferase
MSEHYFKTLNYSLANEDSSLEMGVLPDGSGHAFSIAGSGARVLPLFARKPRHVSIADMAPEQLWISELRIEAVRVLTHREYLAFFGYPQGGRRTSSTPTQRRALLKKIETEGQLSHDAKMFAHSLFDNLHWQHPLYAGRWEHTFRRLARMMRRAVGQRGLQIFECKTLDEQRAFFEKEFPKRRFDVALMVLGNARTFNRLLYKGHFPAHNLPVSAQEMYRRAFTHLFTNGLARENYFLQLIMLGKLIHAEGNPVECKPDVFQQIKDGIRGATVHYLRGDANKLAHEAARNLGPIEFFSFSDVPSYFTGELESRYLQQLKPALAEGAAVVVRNYIHIPEWLDIAGYADEAGYYAELIAAEKVQVYDVHVYRKQRSAAGK